jgi:hypothetical protein
VKNDFNEWKIFHGFDTTKFITNILKNDFFVKDLVDMLSALFCKLQKQMSIYILKLYVLSSHLLNSILLFVFTNIF